MACGIHSQKNYFCRKTMYATKIIPKIGKSFISICAKNRIKSKKKTDKMKIFFIFSLIIFAPPYYQHI